MARVTFGERLDEASRLHPGRKASINASDSKDLGYAALRENTISDM
jgi:hypothetical protein